MAISDPTSTATEREAPTAFRYWSARNDGRRGRLRGAIRRLVGIDLYPSDEIARKFITGLNAGDPVAERFVAETYHGELGPGASRDLLDRALASSIERAARCARVDAGVVRRV
jgi:hypothetical protein